MQVVSTSSSTIEAAKMSEMATPGCVTEIVESLLPLITFVSMECKSRRLEIRRAV